MAPQRRHRLPRATARRLQPHELARLWASYLPDRADPSLRNRLVEHYLPWAQELAASIASRMRLRDRENAVGEVLAALVGSIVPGYDGRGTFNAWARMCIRQILIAQRRKEQMVDSVFDGSPADAAGEPLDLDELPGPAAIPHDEGSRSDLDFLAITRELSDRQAAVLWLRFQRGISVDATADVLEMSPGNVKVTTSRAIAELRKRFGACYLFASRAYIS
jgi:RNA polymerase sigma factor (sigma-70 family)